MTIDSYSLDIVHQAPPCHANDDVHSGSLSAPLSIHSTRPLVAVVVAPEGQVGSVLLHRRRAEAMGYDPIVGS